MWKIFEPDGTLGRILSWIGDLILLNLLWLVCSLPVVTAGASTAALHAVLQRRLLNEDESGMIRGFFPAFRANFRRATAAWLILLALIALCWLNFRAAALLDGFVWRVAAGVGAVLLALELTGIFPLLARYENTLGNQMKNAMLFSVGNLPRVLLLWLLEGGFAALALVPELTRHVLALCLFLAVSGFAALETLLLRKPFARLESAQSEQDGENGSE